MIDSPIELNLVALCSWYVSLDKFDIRSYSALMTDVPRESTCACRARGRGAAANSELGIRSFQFARD